MPRRRLFVLGVIAFVAAVGAEPANRRFVGVRNARLDCNNDPGGVAGTPCRRSLDTGVVQLVTPQPAPEKEDKPRDEEIEETEDEEDEEEEINQDDSTAVDEARGKKKRRGYLKVLFMMAAAAKATLLYAMIHAVALVAGKALVVAKVALALAAAVALKKALGEHHDKTSVEIVKHPHHSYVQTHSASIDYDHHGGGGGGGGFEGHRRRRYAR